MPTLKNPTHEKFAQAIASGKFPDAAAAYRSVRAVSNAVSRVKACNLMKNPAVRDRIDEITGREALKEERVAKMAAEKVAERLAEKVVVSREFVIEQLTDNLKLAKSGEKLDLSAANRAAELLGKEIGMFVDRSENRNVTYGISNEPMSAEQWIAKHADEPASEEPQVTHAGEQDRKKFH